MKNKFKTPPLIEAFCQINFVSDQWDLTIPGEFYKKIQSDFPNKTTKEGLGFGVQVTQEGASLFQPPSNPIMQCFNDGKNQIIQVGSNLLSVNVLPPYIEWAAFKKLIIDSFELYLNVAKPKTITSVNLRYINKINIGDSANYDNFKHSFKLFPHIPEEFPKGTNSILSQMEIPLSNGSILAIAQATLKPEDKMKAPVQLDIQYVSINPSNDIKENFGDWLEEAHENVEKVFLNSLTEEAKKRFD